MGKCREIYAKIEWNWWQDPLQPPYPDHRLLIWNGERVVKKGGWWNDPARRKRHSQDLWVTWTSGSTIGDDPDSNPVPLIGWDWSVPHVSTNIARTNLNQWTSTRRKGISFFGGARTGGTGNYELINNFWLIFHRVRVFVCVSVADWYDRDY